jgi:hypothetical protein
MVCSLVRIAHGTIEAISLALVAVLALPRGVIARPMVNTILPAKIGPSLLLDPCWNVTSDCRPDRASRGGKLVCSGGTWASIAWGYRAYHVIRTASVRRAGVASLEAIGADRRHAGQGCERLPPAAHPSARGGRGDGTRAAGAGTGRWRRAA